MNLFKEIWAGKTIPRIMMNDRCRSVSLQDKKVLDVGAGGAPGSYHEYFLSPAKELLTTDMKVGKKNESHKQLDFEVDKLPFESGSFETVLAFNILEHIYNHKHLVSEMNRITVPGGELIGFVPFLINYHPDPHDYFRYTGEALEKIFEECGYVDVQIEEIGRGPFTVNYNNIILSVPKIFRILLLPFPILLDSIFLKLRPTAKKRYPLGYFFLAKK